ncbi:hypothetical protein AgCh_035679 [Apium graveolens]
MYRICFTTGNLCLEQDFVGRLRRLVKIWMRISTAVFMRFDQELESTIWIWMNDNHLLQVDRVGIVLLCGYSDYMGLNPG